MVIASFRRGLSNEKGWPVQSFLTFIAILVAIGVGYLTLAATQEWPPFEPNPTPFTPPTIVIPDLPVRELAP